MSAAIIRKNKARVLKIITFDCLRIMLLAVALIAIGAGIEVWVA